MTNLTLWHPKYGWLRRWVQISLAGVLCALLGGCADLGYYLQSVQGHAALMQAARPVPDWLADPLTPPAVKERLTLAQQMRQFAVTELGLPDNASYHRYADLKRPAVVWNVVAAPAFSLTLKTWCFPVMGCVSYRGYFDPAQAQALAAQLQAQGLEVNVYGVPAYSTLGWLNWAGGDPLLNTFIHQSEGELARLLFHELAHQVLYAPDDTAFNESFATTVERLGAALWLQRRGVVQQSAALQAAAKRRVEFRVLTAATRQALARVYEGNGPSALVNATQLAIKNEVMRKFRADYAALRSGWVLALTSLPNAPANPEAALVGYDDWVAKANNAALGAQAAYDDLVPDFEALFAYIAAQTDSPWPRFYDAVRQLAELPQAQRQQALKAAARGEPAHKKETPGG
jgi:predicted aminopeptidase